MGADRVADCTCVLPSIPPPGRIDDQRAARNGDPGVGDDGCTSFAPLDCNIRPRGPCTTQRHISPLHCYIGNKQTHSSHCIYRESQKKRKDLSKSCKMQNYLERISKGMTTVGIGALEYERAHFKGWTDRTMEGSFMFLLRIICCNQSK